MAIIRRRRVRRVRVAVPRSQNSRRARPTLRETRRTLPPRGTSVLVCGSDEFATRIAATLDGAPGIDIVGTSPGRDMSMELSRAGWPDVTVIDVEVGRRLGAGERGSAFKGTGARCGVVLIAGPNAGKGDDAQPIKLWRGWSVLLERSATSPAVLGSAVLSAARGVALIDHAINESMIEYLAAQPTPPLRRDHFV